MKYRERVGIFRSVEHHSSADFSTVLYENIHHYVSKCRKTATLDSFGPHFFREEHF